MGFINILVAIISYFRSTIGRLLQVPINMLFAIISYFRSTIRRLFRVSINILVAIIVTIISFISFAILTLINLLVAIISFSISLPSKMPAITDFILSLIAGVNYFPSLFRYARLPAFPTDRTLFGTEGCTVFGYPSTGGVLVKKNPDLVDMLFLGVPRYRPSQRSLNAQQEDAFCRLLRRTGATWWSDKRQWIDVLSGRGQMTAEQKKIMVYGWPAIGGGVWVLRFDREWQLPRDFGRMRFAMDMEERIRIMRTYHATFEPHVDQVGELQGY